MKFLVINTFKKPATSFPQTDVQKMFNDTMKLMEQYRKSGTILAMYFIPGWNKAVTIEEHKSADTLLQNLSGHPMADFMNFEIYPVVDNFDEMVKVLAKLLKVTV